VAAPNARATFRLHSNTRSQRSAALTTKSVELVSQLLIANL